MYCVYFDTFILTESWLSAYINFPQLSEAWFVHKEGSSSADHREATRKLRIQYQT